jgi:hypothetical protein
VRALGTVGLGLRLALAGGRQGLVRQALMAAGVGVGVALLIGGLGVPSVIEARHAREIARTPFSPLYKAVEAHIPPDHLLMASVFDRFQDRALSRQLVAGIGEAPRPPGVERLPGPGELVISPALAELLASPQGSLLRPRLPGRVVGTIGSEGLVFPRELVAYVGAEPETLRALEAAPITRFGWEGDFQVDPAPIGLRILVLIGAVALLVPILVFVATSTRLSAASRERRLAAIRLVGATPAQARQLAAIESGAAAAVGSVLGVALFFLLRPATGAVNVGGYQWFPSDIAPPFGQALVVLVAAPLLAVGASLLSLRRLILTPLGVVRRGRVRRAGPWRLVPAAAGMAGLGLCWVAREALNRGGVFPLVAMGVSFGLVLAGVAVAAPWVGSVLAPVVARRARGMAAVLGARRLEADPSGAGRVVAGFAVFVFGAVVMYGWLGVAIRTNLGYATEGIRPGTVYVRGEGLGFTSLSGAVADVPGVGSVAPLARGYQVQTATEQDPYASVSPVVADCAALRRVMEVTFPGCAPDVGYLDRDMSWEYLGVRPGGEVKVEMGMGWRIRVLTVPLPDTFRRADLPSWLGGDSIILPPSALPPTKVRRLRANEAMVGTDGRAATVERVRNAVAEVSPVAQVLTLSELEDEMNPVPVQAYALVDAGLLGALGLALASLLVVSADRIQERRQPMAVLAASGVPIWVLRRSVAVETALPLVSAVTLAVGLALGVVEVFGAIIGEGVAAPIGRVAVIVGASVLGVGLVTALTLPSLSRATSPESLRAE